MSKSRDGRRAPKARGIPKWLTDEEMDAMARRRGLMILSVLSGEKSVSEAIGEAKIARQTYYQIEERGLRAMLGALVPTTSESGAPTSPGQRIAELERKVEQLETSKRRLERLLLLTRKIVKPGRVALMRGRPRKPGGKRRSMKPGKTPSRDSKTTSTTPRPASTPMKDGEDAR